MTLLLLQASPVSLVNFIIGLIVFVVAVAVALLIVMSKGREEVLGTETKRANSNADLVKVRETELSDCRKKCVETQEELEDVTAELRTLSGIKINELMAFWAQYEFHLAEKATMEQKLRVQAIQLGQIHHSEPPNQ